MKKINLLKMGYVLWLGLYGMVSVCAQNVLPSDVRVNGKTMWRAVEAERKILQTSSAVLFTDKKMHRKKVYGVVVRKDGYIVTKASEIEGADNLSVRVDRKVFKKVEVVAVDPQWDVALLKVASDVELIPVEWSDEEVKLGHWVISNGSASRRKRRVRLGIVCAKTREIKRVGNDVVLGVILGATKELKIKKITPHSGAQKAGILAGDVILFSDGKKVNNRDDLLKSILGKKPGELIEMKVRRGKEIKTMKVELMARKEKRIVSRNDMMGGGEESLSARRDGFPRVIQHDTPLKKNSVGGPLLNLEGKCVGMNIARASRVATFAIPSKELRVLIKKMMPKNNEP